MRIFLAGASGVVGRALVPLLRDAGHDVTGVTRTSQRKAELEALGIRAAIVDVFDSEVLERAMVRARPEIVIHQLTDLSIPIDPAAPEEGTRRNAHLRRTGTANLARAARAARARRVIAQSISWAYAPQGRPYLETDPLDVHAHGVRAIMACDGVVPLENAILDQGDFEGVILRYGQLYGPGTWSAKPDGTVPVHVDAAAYAALLAVDHGRHGIYNIAEPDGAVSIKRAERELGWRPGFRCGGPEQA